MSLFVALILAQAASAAPAAQPAKAPAPVQEATAKIECRMITEPGSRIPNRVCRLDKEWEALAQDAQDDMRSSRNQRAIGLNPGN
jgi:hypothetical protein